MSTKIYTKTGDKGKTSLLDGTRVLKSSLRIEAYGTIDELNAFIGYLHDHQEVQLEIQRQLSKIQMDLFTIGSHLAVESGFSGFELPKISKQQVRALEDWIDEYENSLPELKNFVLPAGHKTVSLCHICRTICRRSERKISALDSDDQLEGVILPYINRLSDYFFVLSRKLAQNLEVSETQWIPRK